MYKNILIDKNDDVTVSLLTIYLYVLTGHKVNGHVPFEFLLS